MLDEIKNIKSEKNDLRKFGITFGIILLVIAGFLFWKEKESFQIFIAIGIFLLLIGITIPIILKPLYGTWMAIATVIGWFMTRIILIILFYLVFTPIGVLSQIFGKQFIELKQDKSKKSYWSEKNSKQPTKKVYVRQF